MKVIENKGIVLKQNVNNKGEIENLFYNYYIELEKLICQGFIMKSRLENRMLVQKREQLTYEINRNLFAQYKLVEDLLVTDKRESKKSLTAIEELIINDTDSLNPKVKAYLIKKYDYKFKRQQLVNLAELDTIFKKYDVFDRLTEYQKEYGELLEKLNFNSHPLKLKNLDLRNMYYKALVYLTAEMSNKSIGYEENLGIIAKKLNIPVKYRNDNSVGSLDVQEVCRIKYELTSSEIILESWNYLLLADALTLFRGIYEPSAFEEQMNELTRLLSVSRKEFRDVCAFVNNVKLEAYISSDEFLKVIKYNQLDYLNAQFKRHAFNVFEPNRVALVVGTMSSGKSTFLNSIIGKELFPSKNEACTAKTYQYLCRTNIENYLVSKNSKLNMEVYENLSEKDLEEWNELNYIESVNIEGPITSIFKLNRKLTFIDTPGPNNSMDKSHNEVMEKALQSKFHKILYLVNATQLATDDDRLLIRKVREHSKKNPQQDIIFIVNKVDEFENNETESLEGLKESVFTYLNKNGFDKPKVIFISALAAKLAQKAFNNENLSRRERNQLSFFEETFIESEFNLERLSNIQSDEEITNYEGHLSKDYDVEVLQKIIQHSGIIHVLRSI